MDTNTTASLGSRSRMPAFVAGCAAAALAAVTCAPAASAVTSAPVARAVIPAPTIGSVPGATTIPTGRARAPGVSGVSGAVALGSIDAAPPPQRTTAARGHLLWAQPMRTLTATQVRAGLTETSFDATQVRHGVALWRIVYATVDVAGRPTTASGLIAVPRGGAGPRHSVIHEHGTLAYRGDAPSTGTNAFVMGPTLQAAAAGYLAVAPDYLGLGYGPGTHPYLHIPTEVSASVDMLTASRELMSRSGVALSGDLFVGGFSQGGPAALAVGRELQSRPRGWRVRAIAPASGPYAIWDEQLPGMFRGEVAPYISVYYITYALTAYDRIFGLYAAPAQAFKRPYAARVTTLFGSNVPEEHIIPALPPTLEGLLTPAGMRLLTDPHGALARSLRDADATCTWRASMPVRLYFAANDDQVPAANTAACRKAFRAKGINAASVPLRVDASLGSTHLASGIVAAGASLAWFRTIAPPR